MLSPLRVNVVQCFGGMVVLIGADREIKTAAFNFRRPFFILYYFSVAG